MKRKAFEEAVFASNLNGTARSILMAYAYHQRYSYDGSKGVWPAQATVAERTGWNPNTVNTYFKALVEDGWLVVIGHTGEFNRTMVVRLEEGRGENPVLLNKRAGQSKDTLNRTPVC